jgi:perosamine synthetase
MDLVRSEREAAAHEGSASGHEKPLPRAPVLDWSSFNRTPADGLDCIEKTRHVVVTTSGRAAIYQALLQLALPERSTVLVPTYHCPTVVAPVVCAGLRPEFFGLLPNGLPDLASIDSSTSGRARAMIVAHYFGLPRSLQATRKWCDDRDIFLIEDCAHCFFGQAGERPVGHWGDFATASLSKFFPLPEGGLLVSAHRPISALSLSSPGPTAQLKGCVDILEFATRHRRLRGLNGLLGAVFRIKNRRSSTAVKDAAPSQWSESEFLRTCDMDRISQAPLWVSRVLNRLLPHGRIATKRRDNFVLYQHCLSGVPGARPLFDEPLDAVAPYVFPLWVDDAECVYASLRELGMPVFRWDRVWPGVPVLTNDVGPRWSHHVLQLLCHQDLSPADIARTSRAVLALLQHKPIPPAA